MQISREKRRMQSNGDKCGYYHLTEKERELRNQHRTQGKQTEGEESIISERSRTEGKKEKTMNQTKNQLELGEEIKQMIRTQLVLILEEMAVGKVEHEGGGKTVHN